MHCAGTKQGDIYNFEQSYRNNDYQGAYEYANKLSK
jgi:hypothetical protein